MEVTFNSESNITGAINGSFDNIAVSGNQFLGAAMLAGDEATLGELKEIQTDQLRDVLFRWAENEFSEQGDDDEHKSIHGQLADAMEEYREDWAKFNVCEAKRAGLQQQIEKLEQQQRHEASLAGNEKNESEIAVLKAQLTQVKEG